MIGLFCPQRSVRPAAVAVAMPCARETVAPCRHPSTEHCSRNSVLRPTIMTRGESFLSVSKQGLGAMQTATQCPWPVVELVHAALTRETKCSKSVRYGKVGGSSRGCARRRLHTRGHIRSHTDVRAYSISTSCIQTPWYEPVLAQKKQVCGAQCQANNGHVGLSSSRKLPHLASSSHGCGQRFPMEPVSAMRDNPLHNLVRLRSWTSLKNSWCVRSANWAGLVLNVRIRVLVARVVMTVPSIARLFSSHRGVANNELVLAQINEVVELSAPRHKSRVVRGSSRGVATPCVAWPADASIDVSQAKLPAPNTCGLRGPWRSLN